MMHQDNSRMIRYDNNAWRFSYGKSHPSIQILLHNNKETDITKSSIFSEIMKVLF